MDAVDEMRGLHRAVPAHAAPSDGCEQSGCEGRVDDELADGAEVASVGAADAESVGDAPFRPLDGSSGVTWRGGLQ